MKTSKVAKRYARALLGLSPDRGQLEAWAIELDRLARIVEAPEIINMFASPQISPASKIEGLGKIAEKLDLSYPVRSFSAVVARHGRIEDFAAIADAYRRMLDDLMGRTRATVIFAEEPSDEDRARVHAGLEAIAQKKVIPTVKTDGTLLGGVVVELEGKTYDGSLATRLAQLQQRLAG